MAVKEDTGDLCLSPNFFLLKDDLLVTESTYYLPVTTIRSKW